MTQRIRLIFVHVPKTGGNSILAAVEEEFQPPHVHRDYADRPDDPSSPMNIDPVGFLDRCAIDPARLAGKEAVVGHFWIRKYDSVVSDIRATILRDPISRALSHYFYWMKRTSHGQLLHDYVTSNNLSFLDFLHLPTIRWFYTNTFFRDVDMRQFDVVECFEECTEDWSQALGRLGLNAKKPLRHLNATTRLDEHYDQHRQAILNDTRTMARIREILAADIAFYERNALDRTDRRSTAVMPAQLPSRVLRERSDHATTNPSRSNTDMPSDGFLHKYFLNNSHKPLHKWMHYFDIYERHLERFRGTSPVMLEIGVSGGGSLAMWKTYLGAGAKIVGIDKNPACKAHEAEDIEIFIGSQDDPAVIEQVLQKYPRLDVILDDGSHIMAHMIRSFELLYDHVAPHGVYMVEDTHTCYWPKYEGGLKRAGSFMEFVKDRLDDINAAHTRGELPVSSFTRATDSICCYDSIVVFERRPQGARQAPITKPM